MFVVNDWDELQRFNHVLSFALRQANQDKNEILLVQGLTCASTLAWSIRVLASGVNPLIAAPMCVSISTTFSILLGSCTKLCLKENTRKNGRVLFQIDILVSDS